MSFEVYLVNNHLRDLHSEMRMLSKCCTVIEANLLVFLSVAFENAKRTSLYMYVYVCREFFFLSVE